MILQTVLSELNPYVYVVGSFARGKEYDDSDIDLYIRRYEDEDGIEQTYTSKIIEVLDRLKVSWDSDFIDSLGVRLDRFIDLSTWFSMPEILEPFDIEVCGVKMQAVLNIEKN
ncbi:hypothetical protein D3C71_1313500 [compost metagenome]